MKKTIIISILLLSIFSSCKDYLDLVPENDLLSIDIIFEKRASTEQFLISCYSPFLSAREGKVLEDPSITGADEYMTNEYSRNNSYSTENHSYLIGFKLGDGLQNSNTPLFPIWCKNNVEFNKVDKFDLNRYEAIRYCNIFIDRIDDVYNMTDAEKKQWKAEVKAVKAFYYYELLRQYGPIVLVPENISVETEIDDMQIARSHVDTCVNEIVKILDEAIPDLLAFSDKSPSRIKTFNREAAYTLKAKVLVLAASPLFNGNSWFGNFTNRNGEPLFSSVYDAEKWEKAALACDEALYYCLGTGRQLITGNYSNETPKIDVILDLKKSIMDKDYNGTEFILGSVMTGADEHPLKLPRYKPGHTEYSTNIYGNLNPTMRMVELFYTENGLPINMDRTWPYTDRYKMGKETSNEYKNLVKLNEEVLNLHLRREPRFYASIACDKCFWKRGLMYEEMNPYKDGVHGTPDDMIKVDVPQNLTGYWVKKGVPDEATTNALMVGYVVSKFRLADLYLLQAEAWNEFEGPSEKVYDALNVVRERAGIPPIQDAWINYSSNPGKINTKEGMREIIQQERMIEFAFEGHRFWDLRRWNRAHIELNKPIRGWNVFGKDSRSFYNNYEGPIEVWTKNKFEAPRDYFWPISSEEIIKSNIVQNLNW